MALGLFPGKEDIKPKEWIIFPVTKRNMSEPMVIMDMVVLVYATDTNRMRIIAIQGGEALPLSTCREDPNLPKE